MRGLYQSFIKIYVKKEIRSFHNHVKINFCSKSNIQILAENQQNISKLYSEQKFQEALDLIKINSTLKQDIFGKNDKDTYQDLMWMGKINLDCGNFEQSMENYNQAKKYAYDDQSKFDISYYQILVLKSQNNYEQALKQIHENIQLASNNKNIGAMQLMGMQRLLSETYQLNNETQKAIEQYNNTINMGNILLNEAKDDWVNRIVGFLIKCHDEISIIQKANKNLKEACKHMENAMDLSKKYFGENHFILAEQCNNMGLCYLHFDEIDKADKYFEQAFEIYRQLVEQNDDAQNQSQVISGYLLTILMKLKILQGKQQTDQLNYLIEEFDNIMSSNEQNLTIADDLVWEFQNLKAEYLGLQKNSSYQDKSQALEILENLYPKLANPQNLGHYQFQQKVYDNLIYLLNQVQKYNRIIEITEQRFESIKQHKFLSSLVLRTQALALYKMKEPQLSTSIFQKAISIIINEPNNSNELERLYLECAFVNEQTQNLKVSLQYYQSCLEIRKKISSLSKDDLLIIENKIKDIEKKI